MRYLLPALIALVLLAPPARAMEYYSDPVYKLLNKDDHHPMEDMVNLAEQGDTRAQFIMGDLYAKGKGDVGLNHADGAPSKLNGFGHFAQIVLHQGDVRRFNRRVRSGFSHRDAHAGCCHRGGVVHAVANHANVLVFRGQFPDARDFVVRQQISV